MRKVFKMFIPKKNSDVDFKLMEIKAKQLDANREERMRDHFRKLGVK